MSNDDSLKELRAYKVGYDLGWYRAFESISNDLKEVADAILNSATFRQIQRETSDEPIFLAKILNIQQEIKDMRNEHMPTLLLEREKINEIAAIIAKLPDGAFQNITFDNVDQNLIERSYESERL